MSTVATRHEITRNDFIQGCYHMGGARIVTITTKVEPAIKSPKKTGMAGRIHKRSRVNGVVGFHYGNAVNRQREREAAPLFDHPLVKMGSVIVEVEHFEPLPRSWGQRVDGTPLVEHKGKYYLELKVEKVYDTEYLLDGEVVDKSKIEQYLLPKKEEGGRQGVENPVILRDYAIASIESIKVGGEEYHLID